MRKTILIFTILSISKFGFCTTWDEPWQDQIIKEADCFIYAKVNSSDKNDGVKIKVLKTLAGTIIKGDIKIKNYYLLHLCSTSAGHGPEFHFTESKEYYFFLKKNKEGEYCISTPTSGFAKVNDKQVYATYRHSYHQVIISPEIYEKTMIAIFNNYHNLAYDKKYIEDFINKYLSKEPANTQTETRDLFFCQHVALECIYHLRLTGYYSKIIPFLHDTSNFHNQMSGARALISYNTKECKDELLNVISDTSRTGFVQVMCVFSLSSFNPIELKPELIKILETASNEESGFGGDIMDPRVCTHVPRFKAALGRLIDKL